MLFGTAKNFRITTALIVTSAVVMIAGCGGAPPEQPPAEAEPESAEAPQPVLMDAEVAAKAGNYDAAVSIIREILSGNTDDIEAAMRTVEGAARSMGLDVVD